MFKEKIFNNQLSYEIKEALGEEITRKILELENSGEKIGEGMSARVFISETDPGICYKINYNNERIHNNSETEGDFLCNSDFSKDIITPEPFYSIMTADTPPFEILVMRRLDAISLKDIIEKDLPLPAGFEIEKFFQALKTYLEALHNKKIFHCDIRSGNIMIDSSTGRPCVIDFGLSKMEYLSSENPYVMKNAKGDTIPLLDDMQGLKEIRLELKKHLFEKARTA
jgi:serine/threonine protein kinase